MVTWEGRTIGAHRATYCRVRNLRLADLRGLVVRHRCDNPACINPNHLELGTHAQNMRDMKDRNRAAKGESNAAARLTEENVREILSTYKRRSLEFGCLAFARKFGVCKKTITDVLDRKTWGHIKGYEHVSSLKRPPFRGVIWKKKIQRWEARIKVGSEYHYVGTFKTEEEASAARDKAAAELLEAA